MLLPNALFKDLYNIDLQKKIVIQTRWKLSNIYNKVYSLILVNIYKIVSLREYFRVLYLQSGAAKWYIEVEYLFHQGSSQRHVMWGFSSEI